HVSTDLSVTASSALMSVMVLIGAVVYLWDVTTGWRLSDPGGVLLRLRAGDAEAVLRVRGTPERAVVTVNDQEPVSGAVSQSSDGRWLELHHGGVFGRYRTAVASVGTRWLASEGAAVAVGEQPTLLSTRGDVVTGGPVKSPMPGSVLAVKAAQGQQVSAGSPLMIVEAMKMEH